ncbi:PP2C family serine/threonine-protein phosphatase [Magnetovibrio blakemorei]|uniref:PPM-type phosphatase domain-containing protein n=1 Tax=Magnetovibrio blakemorei TaxID=28181 RepID=A0A1E5Q4K7_9PROT|nr:hypothetical protein [Magnetovibrio blakemorei]OEJ64957.1 hypothetical protein BEN30_00380 [Magnetovibrio blakemorei]
MAEVSHAVLRDVGRAEGTWTVRGQTTEKPINDCFKTAESVIWRKNEDRFRVAQTADAILATVADGAGSSGMFCGAWAEALVENLPLSPIGDVQGLNTWIDGFWQDFSTTNKQRAVNDPTKLNKFVREGSCSTLSACWIDKGQVGDTPFLNWLCYGDSHFCAFDKTPNALSLASGFPASLQAMASDPHLLNWKDLPDEKHLRTGRITLSQSTLIVLASDGLGEFLHLSYLADVYARQSGGDHAGTSAHTQALMTEFRQLHNGGSGKLADLARNHVNHAGDGFWHQLDALSQALESQESFAQSIKQHHADGLISNDDATLILIDFEMGEMAGEMGNEAIDLAGET